MHAMSNPQAPEITTILTAPDYHVRAALLSLCAETDIRPKIASRMLALRNADDATQALKRKSLKDLFICVQCEKPFSQEDNQPGACSYHDGRFSELRTYLLRY